jgi:hypothetical protein
MSCYLPTRMVGLQVMAAANKCLANIVSDLLWIITPCEGQRLSARMRLLQVPQLRLEHLVGAKRCADMSIFVNNIEPCAHSGINMYKCTDFYSAKFT